MEKPNSTISQNESTNPSLNLKIGGNDYKDLLALTNKRPFNLKVAMGESSGKQDAVKGDVSKKNNTPPPNIKPEKAQNALFGANVGNNKLSEEQSIYQEVKDTFAKNEMMGNDTFYSLITTTINNGLDNFLALSKNQKVEFLIRLYMEKDLSSETALNAILPFTPTLLIDISLKCFPAGFIKDNKKGILIKRLAPEQSKYADQNIILILLASNETLLANCSLDTLIHLRMKENLGDSYYRQLLTTSGGRLNKRDFKKLATLSAKISTICYAYYITAINKILVSIQQKGEVTNKDILKNVKGLLGKEKKDILNSINQPNLINKDQKIHKDLSEEDIKKKLESILTKNLANNSTSA